MAIKMSMRLSKLFGLACLCAVLGFASTATALSSDVILMVDGDGDGYVDIMAFDTAMNFNFGYYDGSFQEILSAESMMETWTFSDGDIVDFAIQSASDSTMVFRLSQGGATVTISDDGRAMTIVWIVGNNNQISASAVSDGFALVSSTALASSTASASPVPEPTAALTFAAGLMVAGWRVQRQSRI